LIKHINLQGRGISTASEVNFIKDKLRAVSKTINKTEDVDFEIDELHPAFDDTDLPVLYVRLRNGQDIAFANLPAGYKRLYSIVLDIAYRAYILNMGNVENIHGIAIIDEINLHLHPSLEQEVLQRLQKTFPTVQFIVSTLNCDNEQNAILSMTFGEDKPHSLPNVYGADSNAIVYDFMGTSFIN
jgi:predicted ATP-binding protein involved in virulence